MSYGVIIIVCRRRRAAGVLMAFSGRSARIPYVFIPLRVIRRYISRVARIFRAIREPRRLGILNRV